MIVVHYHAHGNNIYMHTCCRLSPMMCISLLTQQKAASVRGGVRGVTTHHMSIALAKKCRGTRAAAVATTLRRVRVAALKPFQVVAAA